MTTKIKLITKENYFLLCKCSDNVLKQRKDSLVCTSISSLHIIREHPIFLLKYVTLLKNSFCDRLKRIFVFSIEWAHNFLFSIFSGKNFFLRLATKNDSLDVLFISHLLNNNYGNENRDFYFDSTPYLLQRDGFNSGIALINHTKSTKLATPFGVDKHTVNLFLLARHLSLKLEVLFFLKIVKEVIQLLKLKENTKNNFCSKVLTAAIFDSFSRNTVHSLRLYEQVKELVKEFKPKVMVITYEGHAWERLVFAAARESNPNIKCIGYQHAVIFPLQHAIRRSLDSSIYDPDLILCSGIIGRNQLEKSMSLNEIPKFVLGSNRSINYTNNLDENDFQIMRNMSPISCLVLPEGDIDECFILFEFSIKCAIKNPEINFIWRLHPLLTFKHLIKRNSKLRRLPANINLSSKSLDDDISQSNCALYRGSTAIIQAVGGGLKPIYLSLCDEMSINTLYDVNDYCGPVSNVDDFIKELNKPYKWEEYTVVKDYCSKVFQPLDYTMLRHQIPV